MPTKHRARWFLLVPYLWMVAAVPAVNLVHSAPGGVPILLIWMLAGIPVTTLCIGLIYAWEKRHGQLADNTEEQGR